jgi:hypothetical protein
MNQQQLLDIFNRLKPELKAYEPPFVARIDIEGRYDLWSEGNFEVLGKERTEVAFAALIIQSSYVGFYFMPIYNKPEIGDVFSPELMKLLKGKSCFHVKHLDDKLLEDIRKALRRGYELYEERGWVNAKN